MFLCASLLPSAATERVTPSFGQEALEFGNCIISEWIVALFLTLTGMHHAALVGVQNCVACLLAGLSSDVRECGSVCHSFSSVLFVRVIYT
jgi:hypothetical protein